MSQMEKLKEGIGAFESRFGKKSEQAWQEYQDGKLGDEADIMEWVMLIENLQSLRLNATVWWRSNPDDWGLSHTIGCLSGILPWKRICKWLQQPITFGP